MTIVDDEDYPALSAWKWFALRTRIAGRFYAARSSPEGIVLMHRQILGLTKGDPEHVDHRDRDGLNNQRANLRRATRSQNAANSTYVKPGKSSRFKGVCLVKAINRWQAYLNVDGRRVYIGTFRREEDAADARLKAAQAHFGPFARH